MPSQQNPPTLEELNAVRRQLKDNLDVALRLPLTVESPEIRTLEDALLHVEHLIKELYDVSNCSGEPRSTN